MPCQKTIFLFAIVICNWTLVDSCCFAQERRREFIQGLLQGLIESQLQNSQGQRQAGSPNLNYPPGRIPNGFPQGDFIPTTPRISAPTARLVKVRKQLGQMSSQCDEVITEIRTHEAQAPQLRGILADCLQVKASVDVLVRQSRRCDTVQPILQRCAVVDRDWRGIHYQLQQVRGLDAGCRRCIDKFHDQCNRLCEVLEIEPHFDRIELARLTSALTTSVEHLVQDLYYDLQQHKHRDKIVRNGQELYSKMVQTSPLIQRANGDQLSKVYQSSQRDWRKFSHSLRRHMTPRLAQDVRKIEDLFGQIYSVLWLPPDLDREYLCDVVGTCNGHVDRLLHKMTVAQLLQCQSPGSVMNSAREFKRHCALLTEAIQSGKSIDDLLWDYQAFDNHWAKFNGHLLEIKSEHANRCSADVASSAMILGQTFGTGPVINRSTLLRIGRDLDHLTHQLSDGIHQHVTAVSYPALHQAMCGGCDLLHKRAHQLHQHIVSSRPNRIDIQRFATPLYEQWVQVRPMINKCQPEHRQEFLAIRSQIEPLMVKLQVAYWK
jgi:hypothetical protein